MSSRRVFAFVASMVGNCVFLAATAPATPSWVSGSAAWKNVPPAALAACSASGPGTVCTQLQVRNMPNMGKAVYVFKTRDTALNQGKICVDANGDKVADCGKQWQKQEGAIRFADYGAIEEDLWSKLQGAALAELIPVGIWLATDEPTVVKETVSSAELAANEAIIAAQHAAAMQKLLTATNKFGITDVTPMKRAPVAFARLTASQIVALAKAEPIARLSWWTPPVPQWTTYVSTVGANATGYTGAGSAVCVIEQDLYNSSTDISPDAVDCGTDSGTESHGNVVAGVVNANVSPFGTAPDSTMYYAHWDGCYANAAPSYDWCMDQWSNVWNFSHSCSATDRYLFDYWTKQNPYPLMVLAAGNDGPAAVDCGSNCGGGSIPETTCTAFSALIVGGSNDCNTTGRTDDEIFCPERSTDTDTDRETPYVVAPAQNITAAGYTQSGTSFAAPAVAGIAAQLIDVNPTLMQPWPELMRAVIIATANENVHGGRMTALGSATDHRDGAGEVNALFATDLADSANKKDGNNTACEKGYDMATLNTSSPTEGNYYSEQYKIKTTASGKKARVVVVWDGTATCSDPAAGTCSGSSMDADIDIEVSDGTTTYYSESASNTYEFLEFTATQNVEWTIKIKVYDWFNSSTFMAVAWYVADFDT